jgi:dipeptidyl aminopeptidase/acylaminoacyl peptidase
VRAGKQHAVSLTTCADRIVGKTQSATSRLRSPQGKLASIRTIRPEHGIGSETIVVDGESVLREREDYRKIPGGDPGPLGLVTWSPDSRWLFYFVDPMSSASIAADGLMLRALDVADGHTVSVTMMLMDSDYLTWCGSTLVLTAGGDRLATHNKQLVAARAPRWKPHAIWNAPNRAFGSVACAPGGKNVAVLSQRDNGANWNFFATRWQLWRVGLDGSHRLLDAPTAGYADESPHWSPDASSLLFVRERKGHGTLSLLHGGQVEGPLANLGYSLGYYGHHDWEIAWQR